MRGEKRRIPDNKHDRKQPMQARDWLNVVTGLKERKAIKKITVRASKQESSVGMGRLRGKLMGFSEAVPPPEFSCSPEEDLTSSLGLEAEIADLLCNINDI